MKFKIGIILEAAHISGKVLQTKHKQIRGERIPLSKTPLPFEVAINGSIDCHTKGSGRNTFHDLSTELGWEANGLNHPIQEFPGNGIISFMQVNFQEVSRRGSFPGIFAQNLLN